MRSPPNSPASPLEQALEELEARGLSILYSSDLVKPEMRVLQAPSGTTPRELLEEIVRPHGIRVVEGPSGLLLLTRAARVRSFSTCGRAVVPAV